LLPEFFLFEPFRYRVEWYETMIPPAAVHAFSFFRLVKGAAFPLLANTHTFSSSVLFCGFNVARKNPQPWPGIGLGVS